MTQYYQEKNIMTTAELSFWIFIAFPLTHSVAPSPAFEGRVENRRSGSTLSPSSGAARLISPKSWAEGRFWPSGLGVEGLT
jgi:hypothetical protein